jgi:hypothetical protein
MQLICCIQHCQPANSSGKKKKMLNKDNLILLRKVIIADKNFSMTSPVSCIAGICIRTFAVTEDDKEYPNMNTHSFFCKFLSIDGETAEHVIFGFPRDPANNEGPSKQGSIRMIDRALFSGVMRWNKSDMLSAENYHE